MSVWTVSPRASRHLTICRVGAGQDCVARVSCTLGNDAVVVLALCDGGLVAVAVHGCERHRQVLKQYLHTAWVAAKKRELLHGYQCEPTAGRQRKCVLHVVATTCRIEDVQRNLGSPCSRNKQVRHDQRCMALVARTGFKPKDNRYLDGRTGLLKLAKACKKRREVPPS